LCLTVYFKIFFKGGRERQREKPEMEVDESSGSFSN
jgi:hypothetical protein